MTSSSANAAAAAAEQFAVATQLQRVDANTYSFELPHAWSIGTVPNGGFVTACILTAAQTHFASTLAAQQQPDCMLLHLEFARRTAAGPARVQLDAVKRGRTTSTVHAQLMQGAGRTAVLGYLTFADLSAETGITLPTAWSLTPPPAPTPAGPAAWAALAATGSDAHWVRTPPPAPQFRHASKRVECYYPRAGAQGPVGRGALDHWLRLASGERWTAAALGFAADVALQVTEPYADDPAALRAAGIDGPRALDRLWYPTLVLNLEYKKRVPDEGLAWVFTRVVAKVIRNGRMDLEVYICDQDLDLVALSHHVCMIVDASRNTAARRDGEQAAAPGTSKEKL